MSQSATGSPFTSFAAASAEARALAANGESNVRVKRTEAGWVVLSGQDRSSGDPAAEPAAPPAPWRQFGEFWVGRHSYGLVVLPSERAASDGTLIVYFVADNRIGNCNEAIMRENCSSASVSAPEAEAAVERFRSLRQRELEEKNRRFLTLKGKSFSGFRPRSKQLSQRVTHCYNCRKHLDSTVDVECVACSWILCNCGACGCGFSLSAP